MGQDDCGRNRGSNIDQIDDGGNVLASDMNRVDDGETSWQTICAKMIAEKRRSWHGLGRRCGCRRQFVRAWTGAIPIGKNRELCGTPSPEAQIFPRWYV